MIALARLSLRRPVLALLAWTALAVSLGAIGFRIEHRLSPSILVVPGSESARAEHLARAQFGSTQLTPILLLGPRATLDRDGPALVRSLRARPRTRVLSAWDTGSASAELRPSSTARMIVVSIDRSETAVLHKDLPQIERLVDRRIQAPVHAHITGQGSIDAALKSAMIDQTRRAELFAIALLFLVLLLLLRAPIAAATIPFLFTDLLSVRQFGVAVATAVLLDALVVRPVVLPAAIELLGRRAWWPTRAPVPTVTDPGGDPPSRPAAPPRVMPIPATP